MSMFGTNGVRGIANEYLSCELAVGMGKATAEVLGRKIAVAADTRITSPMIKSALCAGLMSAGADIVDLGMVPTPALQLYVKTHDDVMGGVMITASHNPPEFNGIKCISGDGTECSKAEENAIEDAYANGVGTVSWKQAGNITQISDASEQYVDSIVSKVDADLIRSAGLTVCIDCANGASVNTTPLLLRKLGVRAITINGNAQGEFPGHPSEPTEDNLTDLKRMVAETGADLGAAHDGDADRCVFVTDGGRYVSGDVSLALLAKHMLGKRKGRIMITVATSSLVKEVTESEGGKICYTAVGSPIVARTMMTESGIFGGEENGGLIFADHQYCRDGAMGLARMLELVAMSRRPLSALISELPRYTTIKKGIPCPDEKKASVTDIIAGNHSDGKVNRTDGLRIDYDDGWVLLRPSGTEPKYRIYSESKDPKTAEDRAVSFVREFEDALGKL